MQGKKKTLTYLLYRRVLAHDTFSETVLDKIKGKKFKDPGMWYIYRDNVIKAVLASIAANKETTFPRLQLIEEAFTRGAEDYGQRILTETMFAFQEAGNYSALTIIHRLLVRLESEYDLKVNLPPNLLTADQVMIRKENQDLLQESLKKSRRAVELPENAKTLVLNSLQSIIKTSYSSEVNQNLSLSLRRNLAFLKRDYSSAFHLGELLIARMKASPLKYSTSRIAKELRLITVNAAFLNMPDVAARYCMELSLLKPQLELERKALATSLIKVTCAVAFQLVNLELASQGLASLRANAHLIENPKHLAMRYQTLGLTYFSGDDFNNAIICFQMVQRFRKRAQTVLQWEPQLLIAICLFEKGEVNKVDDLIRSADRAAKKQANRYSKASVAAFSQFYNAVEADRMSQLRLHYGRLLKILTEPDEIHASLTIKIEDWIKAKYSNTSLKQYLLEKRQRNPKEITLSNFH